MQNLKNLVFVNIVWKIFPSLKFKVLAGFAATEEDSAWQLLHCAQKSNDVGEKSRLIKQAIEERHHASLFTNYLDHHCPYEMSVPISEKIPLCSKSYPMWELPIFCFIGESSALRQFTALRKVSRDPQLNMVLTKILSDEIGHVGSAEKSIERDSESDSRLKKAILKIKRERLFAIWMRAGYKITGFISNIVLAIFYLFSGPFFAIVIKRRR